MTSNQLLASGVSAALILVNTRVSPPVLLISPMAGQPCAERAVSNRSCGDPGFVLVRAARLGSADKETTQSEVKAYACLLNSNNVSGGLKP